MKAKIIAFANQKGGVAKTTSSVMTAGKLSDMGYKTLLVDADPQGSATRYVYKDFDETTNDLYDVLTGACEVTQGIIHGTDFGDLIVASNKLYDPAPVDNDPYIIQRVLDSVSDQYDYIIIDTPPNLGMMLIAVLLAADSVVIPTKATKESVQGVDDLFSTIQEYTEYNSRLKVAGFLIVMSNARVRAVKKITEELQAYADSIGCKVFEHRIRTAEGLFGEAEIFSDNIFQKFARHSATKDYSGFVNELLEDMS